MNLYLIGIAIPFLSFFLQVWPRIKNRYFGVDPWHHLMVAEYIRKHKRLPVSFTDKYVIPGPYGYPPFLFFILALFPKKFTDRYNFIFSPIFDAAHNYLIFFAALLLSNNLMVAISAQIIAALTPVTVLEASILNARVLSYLFFSLSFFSLLLFSVNGSLLWLIIAGIVLFVLFFTHKFGIQAYVFSAVVFSLVERNPLYVAFFIFMFGLTLVLGGKRYRLIFNEHMDALKYWIKNGENRFAHQFRKAQKDSKKRQFVDRLFLLSQRLPFASVFGESPLLSVFLVLLIAKNFNLLMFQSVIPEIFLNKLILWIITLSVVGLLILSIKKLRFIGEGYRYIEFVIFPLSIALGSYVPFFLTNYGTIFIQISLFHLAVLLLGIIFLQRKVILNDRNRSITKEKWEIINYLNSNVGDKLRLGIFPLQEGDAFLYFAKGKVLTADSLVLLDKLVDMYPVVTKKVEDIVKKYGLNHIFFDKKYVTFQELGLKKYKIIKDINDFVLIKV